MSKAELHACEEDINTVILLTTFSECWAWKKGDRCLYLHGEKCSYNSVMVTCIRNEKYEKALKELYKIYDKLESLIEEL